MRPFLEKTVNLVRKHSWQLLAVYFFILAAPLIAASLARPFGWWDYFPAFDMYLPKGTATPWSIVANYVHGITQPGWSFRPTSNLLFAIQGYVFGGEFWLWYLVKWSAKAVAVVVAVRLLRQLQVPRAALFATAAVLFFHPCSFELMLFSPDGWLALAFLVTLLVIVRAESFEERPFDLSSYSRSRYLGILLAAYLTLGVKEAGIIVMACLTLVLQLASRFNRTSWMRIAPFYLLLLFWARQLYQATRVHLQIEPEKAKFVPGAPLAALKMVVPHSPFGIFAAIGILLWFGTLYFVFRSKQKSLMWLTGFTTLTAIGVLLFVVMKDVAPRYMVPVVFLTAIQAALCFRFLPRAFGAVALLFAVLFPVFQLGNNYRQALAYQQEFYEYTDILAAMERKAAEGFQLAVSGEGDDIPLENQGSVTAFFNRYGESAYRIKNLPKVHVLREEPPLTRPFVLLTRFSVQDLRSGKAKGTQPWVAQRTEEFRRGDYGLLEVWTRRFQHLDEALGLKAVDYDIGAPIDTPEPRYRLITLVQPNANPAQNAAGGDRKQSVTLETLIRRGFGAVPDEAVALHEGAEHTIVRAASEQRPLLLHFPFRPSGAELEVSAAGYVSVQGGDVVCGITDKGGHDLANQSIPNDGKWHAVPSFGPLRMQPGTEYYYFFFSPAGGDLHLKLKDLKISVAEGVFAVPIPPTRRYGAIGW